MNQCRGSHWVEEMGMGVMIVWISLKIKQVRYIQINFLRLKWKGFHNGKVRVEISLWIYGVKKYLKWPAKALRYLSPVLTWKPSALIFPTAQICSYLKSSLMCVGICISLISIILTLLKDFWKGSYSKYF